MVEKEFDGVGDYIDTSKPFLLVSQHPVTTEFDLNIEHYAELLLNSLEEIKLPTFILWPNEDAGGEQVHEVYPKVSGTIAQISCEIC